MSSRTERYYDEFYYRYQASIGEFGGWANRTKFEQFVYPDFKVLDFGCGGGYLLRQLNCADKLGIEINEVAREAAAEVGIRTVPQTLDVADHWADLVISNHALEHVTSPLEELQKLWGKVKPGGRLVFVVPSESVACEYRPNDVNHHLYTWSPMCLGNLFNEAGFAVEQCSPYRHKWPPHSHRRIARVGGRFWFDLVSRLYACWDSSSGQVRIVAHRPAEKDLPGSVRSADRVSQNNSQHRHDCVTSV